MKILVTIITTVVSYTTVVIFITVTNVHKYTCVLRIGNGVILKLLRFCSYNVDGFLGGLRLI